MVQPIQEAACALRKEAGELCGTARSRFDADCLSPHLPAITDRGYRFGFGIGS